MRHLTRKDIELRIRSYFQQCLNRSSELADYLPEDKRSWDVDAEIETLRAKVARLSRTLAERDYSLSLKQEAMEIIATGESVPDVDIETISYACTLLLRAQIQDSKILQAELRGEIIRPSDPLFEDMSAKGFPPLPGEASEQAPIPAFSGQTV